MSLRRLFRRSIASSVASQTSLSPTIRLTPVERITEFEDNEYYFYNKYSVYYQNVGTTGPNQPYIYVSLTDPTSVKDFTKYDTQENPAGSTERDDTRISKFLSSGTGELFKNRQTLYQKQNAFSETTEYDDSSILAAVNAPATKQDRPIRHFDITSGDTIDGSATGDGASPYSTYAAQKGNAKYGLLRFTTGNKAIANFNTIWGQGGSGGGSGGSQTPYVNQLRSTTPTNTNPYGQNSWKFRPEYNTSDESGIYFSFLTDRFGLMTLTNSSNTKVFYNDSDVVDDPKNTPNDFHKYTPGQTQTVYGANADDTTNYYASTEKIIEEEVGVNNLETIYQKMLGAMTNQVPATQQFRKSAEGYITDEDKGINDLTNYNAIPEIETTITQGPFIEYLRNTGEISVQVDELTINSRGFAKASKKMNETGEVDSYNELNPLQAGQKTELYQEAGSNQSKDLIFFYFYDLINKVYIPFRATLNGIQDNHSADWTDIKYMGRADTLYVYKGFTRDSSFSFRVYANSIDELIPMWKRINYLTGLTRPSKYTDRAFTTNQETAEAREELQVLFGDDFNDNILETTGLESGFIYPPMIEFRIGDLYVDQPAILKSVGTSIPDDAHWETLRDDSYTYTYGASDDKVITKEAYSRQLPTVVDISIQLSILERDKSITSGNHFGPKAGWENTLI